jgi:hypothetical protein
MSTAIQNSEPEPAHHYIVRRTVEACQLAKEAAAAAAEGIATGSNTLLNSLRQRERDLPPDPVRGSRDERRQDGCLQVFVLEEDRSVGMRLAVVCQVVEHRVRVNV